MAVSEMSMLRYVRTLILYILLLPCWGQTSPIPSLEEPFSGGLGAVDASLLDQDDNVDVQALLGQFLYMLNLTEQDPKPRPQAARTEPPEYMLELYNHYAKDRSNRPAANIARSFKNEDSSPYSVTRRGVRTHPLMFNVSVPRHEHIIAAELRLYMLVHRDPQCKNDIDWKVTVFERQVEGGPSFWHSEGGTGESNLTGMQELVVRHGQLKESGWEVFDLTDAVLRWRDLETMSHWLELQVESVNESELQDEDKSAIFISLDIERSAGGKHEPVLIVFSDNESDKDQSKKMIPEDNTGLFDFNELLVDEKDDSSEQQNEALLMQTRSNMIYDSAPRTRRNAKGNQCKRTALYVDFKEIGWDSWIVAPPGFEAYTCHGECNYPLLPQVTPTKHAIIQTLVNLKSPQKASRACCVPTKLEPISLLYENENGHVIFQHKYEGMVVAECGCR
ncbi:bone morphogenetic protein 10-like [Pangasianodon hypophthalmus]|uniref:bone morphogenetic protein 10-like n=1 Tax=Pangasianodon hypophthalmus TaxID=310915 RepID=UPI000EFEFDDA|nr:bone morphogenetic protein 10-like [Pangasianodon hypophthalmus]